MRERKRGSKGQEWGENSPNKLIAKIVGNCRRESESRPTKGEGGEGKIVDSRKREGGKV